MALTVKQLNADASFLLTFEPILLHPLPGGGIPEPFRILLDPWITGPSTIFHSMFSIATHKETPCVCSLNELPEPDLVIISQHKSDHCNEATLRQLPAKGTKTLILAEPAAARVIRSWKYFEKGKVRTIQRWENPRLSGKQTVIRVPVPPIQAGGEAGEVTVAFIPQKRDIKGLHAAIGITYRPPPLRKINPRALTTPPATPKSQLSIPRIPTPPLVSPSANALLLAPPTPPSSPSTKSLRSVRSTASLSPHAIGRSLSVIFSPHGLSYRHLEPYATSHLVAEAALPLTALLHCFDAISNPWWLGGNICAGMPAGQETASALGARAWVSTHDGDKDVRGLVTRMLKTRKFTIEEVVEVVSPRVAVMPNKEKKMKPGSKNTEVLVLGIGEEVALTSEGVWNIEQQPGLIPLPPLPMLEEIKPLPTLEEIMTSL
jgi:hypothetical protein